MPCKGMAIYGNTSMKGLLREGPTLSGFLGIKPMPHLMPFILGLCAPIMPPITALPTLLQAKVTRFAGAMALATYVTSMLLSSVLSSNLWLTLTYCWPELCNMIMCCALRASFLLNLAWLLAASLSRTHPLLPTPAPHLRKACS